MRKQLFKVAIFAVAVNFFFVGSAFAYVADNENSTTNAFSADSLDFSLLNPLDDAPITQLFSVTGLEPDDTLSMSAKIKKEGGLNFQYNVKAVKTSGDDDLCNALKVRAVADGNELYNGSLLGLAISPAKLLTGTSDDWTFTVSLDDDDASLKNKSCGFNFEYLGWQTGGISTTGFFDVETVGNSVATGSWVTAGDVVINEVMWMGSTADIADEWIELRNTTNADINLAGWKIDNAGESTDAITIPSGTITAHEYFLIARKSATASAIKNAITVDLEASAMRLDNGGESLVLKDGDNLTIDSTPVGAWPAGVNGAESKSMERNDDPATGWHACVDSACNTDEFWDVIGGPNYGTPRSQNHSDEANNGSQENNADSACESEKCPAEIIVPSATPEPTPTPSPSASPEPSPTVSPTPNPSPEPIVFPEPSPTPAPSTEPTAEPTPTPEVVSSPTPEPEVVPEPTVEPEVAPEPVQKEAPAEETPSEESSESNDSQPPTEISIFDLLKYFYA